MIKRYARRPKALETYCLADYVSKVVSVSKVKISGHSEQASEASNSETEMEVNEENSSFIHDETKLRYSVLQNGIKITLRSRPKVLRYVRYSEKVDPNNMLQGTIDAFPSLAK